jgi:hypothetical protein
MHSCATKTLAHARAMRRRQQPLCARAQQPGWNRPQSDLSQTALHLPLGLQLCQRCGRLRPYALGHVRLLRHSRQHLRSRGGRAVTGTI